MSSTACCVRWMTALADLDVTSGPLKAGLGRIHREHGVERFPQPAEVRVDAAELDLEEKTSILFRHARSRPLTARGVELIRTHGWGIVDHPHFTPERIRRFVAHRLPALEGVDAPVARPDIGEAVSAEIREPTEAMATSLAALPPEYRGLLVALLDTPPGPVAERQVAAAARRHLDAGLRHRTGRARRTPDRPLPAARSAAKRDLGAPILARPGDRPPRRRPDGTRERFLERCSLEGLLLALSVAGGPTGARRFPLLVADADWDTATGRLATLIPALEETELARLLASLDAAVHAPADARVRAEVQALAQRCLTTTREHLDARRQAIPTALLEHWYLLADSLGGGFAGTQHRSNLDRAGAHRIDRHLDRRRPPTDRGMAATRARARRPRPRRTRARRLPGHHETTCSNSSRATRAPSRGTNARQAEATCSRASLDYSPTSASAANSF